jgi:hypothetical protein
MTLAAILEMIQGVLQFPGEVLSLVRVLKGTPEAQREAIMASVQAAQAGFSQTGRPQ